MIKELAVAKSVIDETRLLEVDKVILEIYMNEYKVFTMKTLYEVARNNDTDTMRAVLHTSDIDVNKYRNYAAVS